MTEQEVETLLPHRCGFCGSRVPILVDDGPLCIRCDRLLYPEAS